MFNNFISINKQSAYTIGGILGGGALFVWIVSLCANAYNANNTTTSELKVSQSGPVSSATANNSIPAPSEDAYHNANVLAFKTASAFEQRVAYFNLLKTDHQHPLLIPDSILNEFKLWEDADEACHSMADPPQKPTYSPPKYSGAHYMGGTYMGPGPIDVGIVISTNNGYYWIGDGAVPTGDIQFLEGYVQDVGERNLEIRGRTRAVMFGHLSDAQSYREDQKSFQQDLAQYAKDYAQEVKDYNTNLVTYNKDKVIRAKICANINSVKNKLDQDLMNFSSTL